MLLPYKSRKYLGSPSKREAERLTTSIFWLDIKWNICNQYYEEEQYALFQLRDYTGMPLVREAKYSASNSHTSLPPQRNSKKFIMFLA